MKYDYLLDKHKAPWSYKAVDGFFDYFYIIFDASETQLYSTSNEELARFLVDLANGKIDAET